MSAVIVEREEPQAFLSHSSLDKALARRVAAALRKVGLEVWIDESEISPGSSLRKAVEAGIEESGYFLLLWSENAARSQWVSAEIDAAFVQLMNEKMVAIVPIRLDATALPTLLAGLRYIDYARDGIQAIRAFFEPELKGDDGHDGADCCDRLGALSDRDLRKVIHRGLTMDEVEVVWNDVLGQMDAMMKYKPDQNVIMDLINRARMRKKLGELHEVLCEDHPHVAP